MVAGAGLAGLAAARELKAHGATVKVFEARDRVGGRVQTIRTGFAAGQHAEAGADLIEGSQTRVRDLATALGLEPIRILRRGWGFYGPDERGQRRVFSAPRTFGEAEQRLQQEIADYCLADRRWDSAVAVALGRQSVAQWMRRENAGRTFVAGLRGLRGFFLADPEDLSLLPVVDQFAGGGTPGDDRMFRLRGGNDRLPRALARSLGRAVALNAIVRRIRTDDDGVTVGVEEHGEVHEVRADYSVVALPASTLRDVLFEPVAEPERQQAWKTLKYGCATRVLLQVARRFWRHAARPSAFGTDLPVGAVWEGNEEQKGPAGILSLLAGGRASSELQAILEGGGAEAVVRKLEWMGTPAPILHTCRVTWEDDPWARGGYAVFDPGFDPRLRAWLARPARRIVFAGEHTSDRWQGYMNGAVESGQRAAAEIRAMAANRSWELGARS